MPAARRAARKKARAADTADDRPVDALDALFQPAALPAKLEGLTVPETYLTPSAAAASQARAAAKLIFDYGSFRSA